MIQESFHSLPRDASGNLYYYAEDFIGSSRVITQSNGTLCSDADFLPFGQEVDYTSGCGQNYKFEGKERDSESNLDNFGARYYSSRMGRWLSADWSAIPEPVPYANPTNPQTLNLYAMVSDNPETFADLDGHDPIMQVAAPAPPAGPGSNMLTNDFDALQALLASLPPLPVPQQPTTPSQNPTDAQAQQQNNSEGQPNQQPSSWDKTKPLPDDPTKLGPDWKKNPEHKDPNGEQHVNDKTGEKLD